MTHDRHKILPEELLEIIEHHKGPVRVELKTGHRTAAFDVYPENETLRVITTISFTGTLPDNDQVSEFLTAMVPCLMDLADRGGYQRLSFDIPHIGERMTMSLDSHDNRVIREKIAGGIKCN